MTEPFSSSGQGFVPLPDGGRIFYTIHGAKRSARPPLLLLRPLGGSIALWGAFRERLATEQPVVSFDPRGAGRSSPAPTLTTTRQMAADAVAVLDYLHIDAAHVFGLSLGGMAASFVAIDASRRVRRLVLGSTARRGLEISKSGMERALSMAQCMLRPTSADVEVCLLRRVLSAAFRREHPGEVRRLEAVVREEPASRAGILKLAAAAALHDARAGLRRVRLPTLILWGERDALLGRDSQAELRRSLPDAEFQVVPRAGHDLSLEQPAEAAERISAFLRRSY